MDFVVQNKSDEQVNTIFLSLETAKEKIPDFKDMLLRYRLEMTSYFNAISGIKFLSLLDSWNSEKKNLQVLFLVFSTGFTSSFAAAAKQMIKDC